MYEIIEYMFCFAFLTPKDAKDAKNQMWGNTLVVIFKAAEVIPVH